MLYPGSVVQQRHVLLGLLVFLIPDPAARDSPRHKSHTDSEQALKSSQSIRREAYEKLSLRPVWAFWIRFTPETSLGFCSGHTTFGRSPAVEQNIPSLGCIFYCPPL